LSVFKILNTAP